MDQQPTDLQEWREVLEFMRNWMEGGYEITHVPYDQVEEMQARANRLLADTPTPTKAAPTAATLTDDALRTIEARAQAAADGPWEITDDNPDRHMHLTGYENGEGGFLADFYFAAVDEAQFCAHAREDIPALLAEIARLRAENTTLAQQAAAHAELAAALRAADLLHLADETTIRQLERMVAELLAALRPFAEAVNPSSLGSNGRGVRFLRPVSAENWSRAAEVYTRHQRAEEGE